MNVITADNGAVSGSAGLKSSADSSGVLALATGTGTTAVTIDASQNVGIGTSSPAHKLHVVGNAFVPLTNSFYCYTADYGVGTPDSAGLQVFCGSSDSIRFGGRSSGTFTERMRINSSGNVGIGTSSPSLNTNGTVLHINNSTASNAAIIHMTTAASGSNADNGLIVGKWSDGTNYFLDYNSNPIVFGINSGEAARIDVNRNLLVGTTSNSLSAKVAATPVSGGACFSATAFGDGIGYGTRYQQSTTNAVPVQFLNSGGTQIGTISTTGSATSYVTSSDYRLKEDIQPMAGALSIVEQLNPVTYKWKADGSDGQGFIAHELQAVIPDAVSGEKDAINEDGSINPQGIDTSFLVATLTAAIQELKAINDTQAQTITALTERVTALENK